MTDTITVHFGQVKYSELAAVMPLQTRCVTTFDRAGWLMGWSKAFAIIDAFYGNLFMDLQVRRRFLAAMCNTIDDDQFCVKVIQANHRLVSRGGMVKDFLKSIDLTAAATTNPRSS